MQSLPQAKAEFLRVLAARIVPETANLDAAGAARFFGIIDSALMDREPGVRRQFATFLGVLRWAPLLRYGRPLENLPPGRQDAVLRWFEDCPVSLLRKGFWGLKAMVFMGYYGQPKTHAEIGYAVSFDGGGPLHA
ncbi:MAG TPA: gluconate 2-dehydrogenase subunit 3 family protein [Chondromyces sp.]|nr:gluconate 2-dehydrogenase subunit 3 family protein [Chondromyces sp.]